MGYSNGGQPSYNSIPAHSPNGPIAPDAHFGDYFVGGQRDSSSGFSEPRLVFEFFEDALPDQRLPLIDKIRELATQYPPLFNGQSADFHEKSWFSVIWFPILCHNSTMNMLRGQIITFHRIHHSESCVDNLFCAPPFSNGFPPDISSSQFVTSSPSSSSLPPSISSQQAVNGDAVSVHSGSEQPPQPAVIHAYAPTCGLVPYKMRNDAWFVPCQLPSLRGPSRMYLGPVHLLRAASNLLEYVGANHPDFEHCIALCPELKALQEFPV